MECSARIRPLIASVVLTLALVAVLLPASALADVGFGPALTSSASDAGAGALGGVAAGNDAGVVATAYTQKVGAVYHAFARVKPAGTAKFGPAKELSTASSGSPAAAVAADGTVTVVWVQASPCAGSSLWMATAPPGAPFGPATKVSDNAFAPDLAVTPNGTVVLVYKHDKGSCVIEQRANARPRSGAPSDVVISNGAYGSVFDAQVRTDSSGVATVAFVQSQTAAPFTYVLQVARRAADGVWNSWTHGGPGTSGSALAVAPDGGAVVAYNTKVAAGYATEVRSRAPGAAVFGPPQTVTDTSENEPVAKVAIFDGGAAAVTTSREFATVRPPGAGSFPQTAPIGLPVSAAALTPMFSRQGELVFFDAERPAGGADFALVARVRRPSAGSPLGPPQPTGLTSQVTGAPSLAAFGANNVAAAWANSPTGASVFGVGLALGDGTPPAPGPVSAPSGGTAGAPLGFSAAPTDDLGIADVRWTFGDGATADDATTTHAFAAPGSSTWSVEVSDLGGRRASAAGALAIQPAPRTQRPLDTTKPTLGALRLAPTRFRASRSGPSIAARGRASVTYVLSEAATTRLTVKKAAPGRRLGGRCAAPTVRNRSRPSCTRWVRVRGRVSHRGKAGSNKFRFTGRLAGRTLRPGRYRLIARATDHAGNRSAARRARFRIVR